MGCNQGNLCGRCLCSRVNFLSFGEGNEEGQRMEIVLVEYPVVMKKMKFLGVRSLNMESVVVPSSRRMV